MHFDLVVRGATLVTSERIEQADIAVSKGKIAAIGHGFEGATYLEAGGLHVLCGVIDSQVHFREPGLTHKEDLESGTRAAIAGGVTSIFEMPNTQPSTVTPEALNDKLDRAIGRAWCDHAFFVGASAENADFLHEYELLPGTPGVKIFMGSSTGSLLVSDDETLRRVLRNGRTRCPVHSEDHPRLESRKSLRAGSPSGHMHPVWRDEEAACLSTRRLIALAAETERPVHLLHVSTAEEIGLIRSAKRRGIDLTAELTPQHLWFAAPDVYDSIGTYAVMNPPVRSDRHRQGLIAALKAGVFDVFGSDHAPHLIEEKLQPYPACPSGMPGVQTLLPAVLTLAKQIDLDLTTVARMTSERPAELYNVVGKGKLEVGFDADFAIVDLGRAMAPSRQPAMPTTIQSKCGWSPFENIPLIGWPRWTVLRGEVVFHEGTLVGQPVGVPVAFNKARL